MMQAHRLQRPKEHADRLKSHEVVAVIQPAIVVYGNCHGEDYDQRKIWYKGMVLVREEKD